MRRHPQRFVQPPRDPRAKRVVSHSKNGGSYVLELECGHAQLRRLIAMPKLVICTDCPAAGGMGGKLFEPSK